MSQHTHYTSDGFTLTHAHNLDEEDGEWHVHRLQVDNYVSECGGSWDRQVWIRDNQGSLKLGPAHPTRVWRVIIRERS